MRSTPKVYVAARSIARDGSPGLIAAEGRITPQDFRLARVSSDRAWSGRSSGLRNRALVSALDVRRV